MICDSRKKPLRWSLNTLFERNYIDAMKANSFKDRITNSVFNNIFISVFNQADKTVIFQKIPKDS